ncbi:MAG: hypothetical protein AAF713_02975 [Pseudomonadota bacterium]
MSISDGSEEKRWVDPAGRPLEGRRKQALVAFGILMGWIVVTAGILAFSSDGLDSPAPAPWLTLVAILGWVGASHLTERLAMVWPASACGIVGSLSLGLAVEFGTRALRTGTLPENMAVISSVTAVAMGAFLFRFRLPGLVSPVVTFTIFAIFLGIYGTDPAGLQRVEGLSPRGILAALLETPHWSALAGVVAFAATVFARRLDMKGDDFGLAAARPLHIIGSGVFALVLGRALAALPQPVDTLALTAAWLGAFVWALRINRVAVLCAIHLAMARPIVLAVAEPFGITPGIEVWSAVITGIIVMDLALWPLCHKQSLRRNWTLAPGGLIPRERKGWVWRYWPYVSPNPVQPAPEKA